MRSFFLRTSLLLLIVISLATVIFSGPARWMANSNGRIPNNAVEGGYEQNKKVLYICKAFHKGAYHSGKVVGSTCNFGYGGKELTSKSYYVLTGKDRRDLRRFKWVSTAYGKKNRVRGYKPVSAGNEGNKTLYVCRARHDGGMHPGKVVGRTCNIGYGGREITLTGYQLLLYKEGSKTSKNYYSNGRASYKGTLKKAIATRNPGTQYFTYVEAQKYSNENANRILQAYLNKKRDTDQWSAILNLVKAVKNNNDKIARRYMYRDISKTNVKRGKGFAANLAKRTVFKQIKNVTSSEKDPVSRIYIKELVKKLDLK